MGATAACWATRVSFAVTRITPGQTLRQNGNTARASELFKPSAANSARRIWASSADRSLAWKSGAGSRRKIGSDGTTRSMQGDGYAIAGERGDDGCLIADAVEPILRCAADVTIRDMSDGDRLGEQRLRTGKPHREVWTVLLHLREEVLPAMAHTRKIPLLHHPAEICNAVFNRLDTTIASGIEHQLRGARELCGLRGRQTKIHLEGDPSLRVLRARVAAKIVLACGEKGRWSFAGGAVVERSLPDVACRANERLHTATALYADSRGDGSAMSAVSSALRVSEAAGKGNGASAARLAAARRT